MVDLNRTALRRTGSTIPYAPYRTDEVVQKLLNVVLHEKLAEDNSMQTAQAFTVATGVAAAIVIVAAGALAFSRPAAATVQFAKATGKACGDCHTKVTGGGALTPLGEQFKANGNKMPASP